MQKCVVVSMLGAKFSALALKASLSESIQKVAQLGYDVVELAIRDPKLIDRTELKELLKKYNLTVPAIGTGQAYGEEGLSFTDPDLEVQRKAVQRIKDQMDLAEELGGARVIIGLIRGTVRPGWDPQQAEAFFIKNMTTCLDYKPRIKIVLEPINRYETNLYNDTHSTREIIDKIARPNCKMLIDTFHMNIEEPDINESIVKVKDYIAHVHFADSNRWAPGCGHIDFASILTTLKKIGYQDAISAEILPFPSPDECMKLTMNYYKKLGI